MNFKVIARNVGYALLVSALFMFFSILVSVANGNDSALAALLISFVITFAVGIFPFIFVGKTTTLSLKEGYVTIVLSWLLSFIFGMLPYVLWGGPFSVMNAWFESVSGFTCTGATILSNVEGLPNSLIFWRSSTHFIGGLGVVVFLLLIIPSSSQMKLRLTNMELSSLSKSEYRSGTNKTTYIFAYVYLGLFAACTICYIIAGMPPFDAVNHAMSVVATGGFSTKNLSIGAYDSAAINIVSIVFMFLGSVHFGMIFLAVVTRSFRPFKNEIFKFYVWYLAINITIVTVLLHYRGIEDNWGDCIMSAAFHIVSYASTSGLSISDTSLWPVMPAAMLMLSSVWCGMAGSTSGGVKADRALIVCKEVAYKVKQVLHPASVNEVRVNKKVVKQDDVAIHVLYTTLYMLVVVLGIVVCLIFSPTNNNAPMGLISCLGNVGASVGGLGSWSNFGSEPEMSKLVYTVAMFLGRVEIYPILTVISLLFSVRKGKNNGGGE